MQRVGQPVSRATAVMAARVCVLVIDRGSAALSCPRQDSLLHLAKDSGLGVPARTTLILPAVNSATEKPVAFSEYTEYVRETGERAVTGSRPGVPSGLSPSAVARCRMPRRAVAWADAWYRSRLLYWGLLRRFDDRALHDIAHTAWGRQRSSRRHAHRRACSRPSRPCTCNRRRCGREHHVRCAVGTWYPRPSDDTSVDSPRHRSGSVHRNPTAGRSRSGLRH